MADLPRDPRQLARDILAGKVRIEDLARERQRRAGGMPQPGLRQQANIPAPRQAPPAPVQRVPVRSVPRPMPPRPVQRPMPVPVQRPAVRQPERLQVTVAPPPEPVQRAVAPVVAPMAGAGTARQRLRVEELVRSKRALRQGIVLAEILGRPVGLREGS